MFVQCAHVSLSCVNVSILCIYMRVLVRIIRRIIRGFDSDKRVDVIHATRRRKCILSLGTINTEASKLGERVFRDTLARLYSSRKIECALNAPFSTSTSFPLI